MLLQFDKVSANRGNKLALKPVSFFSCRWPKHGITGSNDAGKSTLLKLMARQLYLAANDHSELKMLGHDRWSIW